jgi:hypothetical protein
LKSLNQIKHLSQTIDSDPNVDDSPRCLPFLGKPNDWGPIDKDQITTVINELSNIQHDQHEQNTLSAQDYH